MENRFFMKQQGFTLVEILVALAIAGIVTAAIYSAFQSQQKSYIVQDQVAEMQQNLRAALDLMVKDIRMAGYDPTGAGNFGFLFLPNSGHPDYGRYTGTDAIAFSCDDNKNGTLENSDSEQVAFRLNVAQDGTPLTGSGRDFILRKYSTSSVHWQPVAENIVAIGFAYAFDNDGDDQLDTAGGQTIWAIDSPDPVTHVGDQKLDTNLDVNGDGLIDAHDDMNGDNTINSSDNASAVINPPVDLDKIRAVRIWLLVRTSLPDRKFVDTGKYVVGNKIVTPVNGYRYRLLSTIVKCRNMGL